MGSNEVGAEYLESSQDDDLPDQLFEIRALRQFLPSELHRVIGMPGRDILVERRISEKTLRDHPIDHVYLERLGELIGRWQHADHSLKAPERFESYGQLDEIWFAVVIRSDVAEGCCYLVTMHRIYRRKMESRVRKGYLVEREDRPLPGREIPGTPVGTGVCPNFHTPEV